MKKYIPFIISRKEESTVTLGLCHVDYGNIRKERYVLFTNLLRPPARVVRLLPDRCGVRMERDVLIGLFESTDRSGIHIYVFWQNHYDVPL